MKRIFIFLLFFISSVQVQAAHPPTPVCGSKMHRAFSPVLAWFSQTYRQTHRRTPKSKRKAITALNPDYGSAFRTCIVVDKYLNEELIIPLNSILQNITPPTNETSLCVTNSKSMKRFDLKTLNSREADLAICENSCNTILA